MIYYFLLAFCAILFSWQFVFNKIYQKIHGTSPKSVMLFTGFSSLVFFIILFCVNGFKITFSWFSFLMAVLYAISFLSYVFFGFSALKHSTLGQYTLFAMLGGMMLPFTYGFFIKFDDALQKILCCVGVTIGLFLSLEKGETQSDNNKKGLFACVAVFICNGLVGIASAIHQANANAVPSNDFFLLFQSIVIVICFVAFFLLKKDESQPTVDKKQNLIALSAAGGYGIVNGLGNLLALICLLKIEPSAQYPIITGGCIAFSMIFGVIFFKEKITKRKILSLTAILLGTAILLF